MKIDNLETFNALFRSKLTSLQEPYEELNSAMRTMIELMDDDPRREEYLVMWSMINERFQIIFDKL